MIDGVTKPFELGREPLSPEQRRAAATAYIAGMQGLFDRFEPLEGGGSILSLDVPFDGDPSAMGIVAERDSSSLEVFAPDSQWHSYGLRDGAVWRHDGIMLDSLNRPDAERVLPPRDATKAEKLAHLHRLVAEEAVLSAYEPNQGYVDEEEVEGLFSLLMQGRHAPKIDDPDDL